MTFEKLALKWAMATLLFSLLLGGKLWRFPNGGKVWLKYAFSENLN